MQRLVNVGRIFAVLSLLIACTFISQSAVAQLGAAIVDQEQPYVDASKGSWAIGGASDQKLAQTFEVGFDGTLESIRFVIGCSTGKLVAEIQGVTRRGEPDGRPLARRAYPVTDFPSTLLVRFDALDIGRGSRLSAGDMFAIVLTNPTGSCGVAQGPTADVYRSGRGFFDARPNPPGWIPIKEGSGKDDLPFQVWLSPS